MNDEALGATKDLGVEEGEPQLEKQEELENPHSDGWRSLTGLNENTL